MQVQEDTKAFISSSAVIMPGASIGLEVRIEDEVTIGPNAAILGKEDNISMVAAEIRAGVVIGANATVLPGVVVGMRAVLKPGSVVTRSVPPLAVVDGNPAIIIGYVSTSINLDAEHHAKGNKGGLTQSIVKDVTLHQLALVSDLRGNLSVGEFEKDIPFKVKRYFLVFDVPTAETRGEHTHKIYKQFLVCIKGSCRVVADDGINREEFILDSPAKGLYLPAMTWGIQYCYTNDAHLLVFASEYYDSTDYIRDYDQFIAASSSTKAN
ncbi:MAG: WxcM-like domain-containing protein [Methylococcales bacterium]|nr:WxcM-like domain-containing protein [Methylococcales bacterium]